LHEVRDAAHAAASELDIARIAGQRIVTPVAGERPLERADRLSVVLSDAKLLETKNVRSAKLTAVSVECAVPRVIPECAETP
jgi:hypothetical protein